MRMMVSAPFVIGPGLQVIEKGAVVYEYGRILCAGSLEECKERYTPDRHIHFDASVIAPGFVNAHMHLYGILAHGLLPPVPVHSFEDFLEGYWWPMVENRLDVPMIEAAARTSALELLDSGVTTVCDVLEAPFTGIRGLECQAEVLRGLGMRGVLSLEASQRISEQNGKECLEDNLSFFLSTRDDPLISSMLCLHTAFTCSGSFSSSASAMAKANGAHIQLHLNESSYEPQWCIEHRGMRSTQWYESIGILGTELLAAQCVQMSDHEMDLLSSRGVRAVHVPLSNCEVGGGIAPVPDLLNRGITVALGSDGYVNNFFEIMRSAFLIHKGHRKSASVMPASTVWRMATEEGAAAVFGSHPHTGSLNEGMRADFQVISLSDLPTEADSRNIFDQLVLFRNPRDVTHLCIEGIFVKEGGKLVTGDPDEASRASRKEARRLKEIGLSLAHS